MLLLHSQNPRINTEEKAKIHSKIEALQIGECNNICTAVLCGAAQSQG